MEMTGGGFVKTFPSIDKSEVSSVCRMHKMTGSRYPVHGGGRIMGQIHHCCRDWPFECLAKVLAPRHVSAYGAVLGTL